jgi:adenine-specific DNA methylase
MSQETERAQEERQELPIERGFPIERVNEIAEKEGRAKMHYRPIYTMHKWWARRLGCVFRTICLYTLLESSNEIEVYEPGESTKASEYADSKAELEAILDSVSMQDPESLWDIYSKDVRVDDKKILDPFMGGGTSLVEASRFGAETVGYDLNPVAWFVTKKQLEAGHTDVEELEETFEQVEEEVADEITRYYRTPCPNDSPQKSLSEQEDPEFDSDDPLGLDADFEYHVPDDLRDELSAHDHYADVMYNFWVKELDCNDCGNTVPLFKDYRVAKGRYENDDKYNVLCPDCESVVLVDDWQSESRCSECGHNWTPKQGTVSGSKYACPDCGLKYPITDAIQEQGGFDMRLYAVEYYCPTCDDDKSRGKSEVKGYKQVEAFDEALYDAAEQEWEAKEELHEYVPDEEIPEGAITASSSISGNDVFQHGYEKWSDFFNTRQLLCIGNLLREIEQQPDRNLRELLLLALSDSLRTNSMFCSYDTTRNGMDHIFRNNSFNPVMYPAENNLWGTKYGRGTFTASYDMMISGVEYANSPTESYLSEGQKAETEPFAQPIGENSEVYQGDMRTIEAEDEYDAVITDPPYYDNIIYSEVADYFYVWQKILLEDDYECFRHDKTPRAESIVTNPFLDKTEEDFETELHEAFTVVHRALKDEGVLAFTYHHSDSESWGELLGALCDVGFEITATYPITADTNKFIEGEAVEFDIIIVARPADEREPISWKNLRRNIYRTSQETRQKLEENRDLSRGDVGVVEMGECFHEYSKHHGEVRRAGGTMTAKEVVDEIYGIIQEASQIGEIDVFLDLLEEDDPSYDDVNKLCRGTNADPDEMKDKRLYIQDDGFELGTWDNEKRIAYIQERTNGGDSDLTDLDKAQFLRHRYEKGKSIQNYLNKWEIDDDMRELAEALAEAADDETYLRILGSRADPTRETSIEDFDDE